jgi:acetate kinase
MGFMACPMNSSPANWPCWSPIWPGRVIAAHLGNGASLCAMKAGQSVDTSMGFSALDGLMMGTRCGTLDAGAVLHLMLQRGMSAPEVQDMLYRRSGLLGVSGLSSDMRELSASPRPPRRPSPSSHGAPRGRRALITSLGGLDGIVFTAGIGEHDAAMRADLCPSALGRGGDRSSGQCSPCSRDQHAGQRHPHPRHPHR